MTPAAGRGLPDAGHQHLPRLPRPVHLRIDDDGPIGASKLLHETHPTRVKFHVSHPWSALTRQLPHDPGADAVIRQKRGTETNDHHLHLRPVPASECIFLDILRAYSAIAM